MLIDIVQKDLEWMDDAKCIGNSEPFDKYDQDRSYAEEADQLCLHCPVVKECFEAGMKKEHGQWGGIYWGGNGKPDERANAHKTAEYLDEIKEAVSD